MQTSELARVLHQLERTLAHEGGILWREAIFGGEAAPVEWPSDLPPLTDELETWFAWRATSSGASSMESWRSASWAVKQYRAFAADPRFRRSLVPVLDGYFVDIEDGSVWARGLDEEGRDRVDRSHLADLVALLASIEAEYAARRRSPWRRFRVERPERTPWSRLDAVPEADALAQAPLGTCLIAAPESGRWPKGEVVLKHAQAKWIRFSTRVRAPFEDACIDDAVTVLRYELATGNDALEGDVSAPAVAERITSLVSRWTPKGGVELRRGLLRIWQQPTMPELLDRLDRQLTRVAPHVRCALARPAQATQIADLETSIGVALPRELRAL